jgi:hypothetical protein
MRYSLRYIFTIIIILGGYYASHQEFSQTIYSNQATAKPADEDSRTTGSKAQQAKKGSLEKELAKAIRLLKKTSRILKQERYRWRKIHSNPIPDKVRVEKDAKNKKMYVIVDIDTHVRNEVNRQHITRKYTLKYIPPRRSLFEFVDLMVGAGYTWKVGYRPVLGVGIRPLNWRKVPAWARGIGAAVQTTVYSSGFMLYYNHPAMKNFYFGALLGWDWNGEIAPGACVGIRF